MKYKFSFGILFVFVIYMLVSCTYSENKEVTQMATELSTKYRDIVRGEFLKKVRRYNADTRYLVIVDYSIPSNDYRLFIWDTDKDEIVEKFWCAHGFGGKSTPEKPEFSNIPGSNCSSIGWYIVERGIGISPHWGYQYHAVDGLDTSNSNARRRQILIHPWSSVNRDYKSKIAKPMELDGRCAGCFTTTDEGFITIDKYIKSSQKRILLFAINGI